MFHLLVTGLQPGLGGGWLAYLGQLHLHVGEHVQEAHHRVPEPAVGQALLVAGARALRRNTATVIPDRPVAKANSTTTGTRWSHLVTNTLSAKIKPEMKETRR